MAEESTKTQAVVLFPFQHRWMSLVVLAISAIYFLLIFDRGWIPHDEGLLGQSAERVLQGQWPHLDFDDPYTGGLTMLHALAFKLFGVSQVSLRWMLFVFSMMFVACTYWIASRIVNSYLAATVTLLALVWGVPNYFAGLPSWYNLYFAIFTICAFLRYSDSRKVRWLVFAGVLSGLSFLTKLTGLYLIAASLLYIVYVEQETAVRGSKNHRNWSFLVFTTLCILLFIAGLFMLVVKRLTAMDVIHFVLPGSAVGVFLIYNEFRLGSSADHRFVRLFNDISIYLVGVALPIAIFLVPYFRSGGISQFVHGVFVLPSQRIEWTDYQLPTLSTLMLCAPFAILLFVPIFFRRRLDHWLTAVALGICCAVILVNGSDPTLYKGLWATTRPTVPLLAVSGMLLLATQSTTLRQEQKQLTYLLIAVMSLTSLVEFPYSFGVYFCYIAPIVILAFTAMIGVQEFAWSRYWVVLYLFYFGFAVLWLNQGHVRALGVSFVPHSQDTRMKIPRSGLWVSERQKKLYESVIAEIKKHSDEGSYIYATADCPEIYFLSARKNPTRTFYDFFEPDFSVPIQRQDRILQMLEDRHIDVVVFHWQAEFSKEPTLELTQAIAKVYPNVQHFFRDPNVTSESVPTFSVAWRERK